MIGGKLMRTDTSYFAIEKDSASSLKCFATDRKKYYRKYILGEQIEEVDDESKAVLMGNLVDCLLLVPEEFDTRFFKSTGEDKPTGQMLDFVNYLYEETMSSVDGEGEIRKSFLDRAKEAYIKVGFKRDSFEKVMERFLKEGKSYFDEILEVRPKGLQVITAQDHENALKIIDGLKENKFVGEVINLVESNEFEVFNQLVIEFVYQGIEFKVMIDKVIVSHVDKTVTPYDLKVTWAVEDFYQGYYLYRKAYIQQGLYTIAVNEWLKEIELDDYSINPFTFIVADSINYNAPLLYQTSEDSLQKAIFGFEVKGKYYPGITEIINNIRWHKSEGIWNISAENFKNKGVVII